MATFGPVASAMPNVLFNPMAVDQAVQGQQRNQLMMDNARQDQQQQTFTRDMTARQGMARELSALPEHEAEAQWGTYRQRLQAAGLGQGLPEQFPGMERLKAVASSDLTTFQRMQLEEKRRSSEVLMGLIGGGMPGAAPGAAPASGTPHASASPPPEMMPHFQAASAQTGIPVPVLVAQAQQESGFRPDAVGRSGEVGVMQVMPSTARQPGFGMQGVDPATLRDPAANIMFGAQYLRARSPNADMANPAQRDAALRTYNGGGDPNYAQNVTRNLPGAQAATQAPAAPALLPNGLTQQQAQQLAVIGQTNPQAAVQQMGVYQQQNRMEADRLADRQRQAERDGIQQQQQVVNNQRADAAANRAEEAARRQDEAANRRIQLDEEKARREVNPGPSPADRTKLKTIETEAASILDALEAFRTTRRDASSTSRIASAVGLPTELNSTYGNAALLAKGEALYNLGVLNGPDLGIIRRVLADPGTAAGGVASQETVEKQIGQVRALLEQRLATARTQYGGQPAAAPRSLMDGATPPPPGSSATAPAASRGGPQVGVVEDGYRYKGGNPASPDSWERAQ